MAQFPAHNSVIIIGAGLGGLCLAQALVGHDIDVAVFERDPSPDVRGQGYRLTIDPTGSMALRTCLPPAVYEFIRSTAGTATDSGTFLFLDERARILHRLVTDLRAADESGYVTGQVDRRTLREALLSGLGHHVRFGKSFVRYEETEDHVIAYFDDGSVATAHILVGADGVSSAVRRQCLPDAEPRDTGIVAIYGRTRLDGLNLPVLGRILSDAGIMALGPRGVIFFATAMRFREQPAIASNRLGVKIGTWPTNDYLMWAVAARKSVLPTGTVAADLVTLRDVALRAVGRFQADFKTVVERCDPADIVLVPIRATPSTKEWRPGLVTLIGDAIHVMPPFGAHGANTALRDAQLLATKLVSNNQAPQARVESIGAYESDMRRYGHGAVQEALRMMTMATADFPFKRPVFRMVMRLAARSTRRAP